MGDYQNYGPFLGPYENTGPNLGDPKRDHNFDNPLHEDSFGVGKVGCSAFFFLACGDRV